MHFAFLLDSSVGMNAPFAHNGLSYWECAKAAVEQFFKTQVKVKGHEKNRYCLLTYDESPACFASTFQDDVSHLLNTLKYMQATSLCDPGPALSRLFEYLHSQALIVPSKPGVPSIGSEGDPVTERPGLGLYPGNSESVIIFWITKRHAFFSPKGGPISRNLHIVPSSCVGSELYMDPFRWGQRLYTLILDPSASYWQIDYSVSSSPSTTTNDAHSVMAQIQTFSHNMAGKCWTFTNETALLQSMDNCIGVSRLHPEVPPSSPFCHIEGVWLKFVELGKESSSSPSAEECILLFANRTVPQTFPIPETAKGTGRKRAHPRIVYSTKDTFYQLPEGFPVDRYSMEQSALSHQLLSKKTGTCWPLFVMDSHSKSGLGLPFGYLKKSTVGNSVNMYILPYNFPRLVKLLFALRAFSGPVNSSQISSKWKEDFLSYLKDIPPYYIPCLRRAFTPSLLSALHMAQIWEELLYTESSILSIGADLEHSAKVYSLNIQPELQLQQSRLYDEVKLYRLLQLSKAPLSDPLLFPRPFHLPISVMGDYHPHMLRYAELRSPNDDDEAVALKAKLMFGNPYRTNNKTNVSIDEEGEAARMDEVQEEASSTSSTTSGLSFSLASSTSGLLRRKPRKRVRFASTPFQMDRIPRLSRCKREPILFLPAQIPTENGPRSTRIYSLIKNGQYPDMLARTKELAKPRANIDDALITDDDIIVDDMMGDKIQDFDSVDAESLASFADTPLEENGSETPVSVDASKSASPPMLIDPRTRHESNDPPVSKQLLFQQQQFMLKSRLQIKRLIQQEGQHYNQNSILLEVAVLKANPMLSAIQARVVLDAAVKFARRFRKPALVQSLLSAL